MQNPTQKVAMRKVHVVPATTPAKVTPEILELSQSIGGTEPPPVYVYVQAAPGERLDNCHNIVARIVGERGGQVVNGWIIWEWPRIYLEVEFHAVWESPDGQLIDVTSKRDGERRILFVRDPSRKYEGERIGNVRRPLLQHPLLDKWLANSEEGDRLKPKAGTFRLKEAADFAFEERTKALSLQLYKLSESLKPKPKPQGKRK